MKHLTTFLILMASSCVLSSCSTAKKQPTYSGFGAESISKETLTKYAPPSPNSELKNIIEKLVDIRAPSAGMVTNDGKNLFINWNVTGSRQVWKLQGAQSFPLQLTGGEDGSVLVGMSPSNEWIAIARDSKGDENPGLYLMSTKGGELKKVYYNSKHQTGFSGFTEDSKALYYTTNDKSPSSYSIYKYTIATNTHELIWDKPGIWSLSDIEGDMAILTLSKGSMENEHFLLNLKTKESTPLIGQNEKEDYDVSFSNKKGEYFVLTNKLLDFRKIYILKNNQLTPFGKDENGDISSMTLSQNKNYLSYTVNSQGYGKIQLFDLKKNKYLSLPHLKDAQQSYMGQFSANEKFMTYAGEFHNLPQKNYVFNIASQKAETWVTPSTPEINTLTYIKPSLESYKAQDGTDIPMYVWRSEKCKKEACPVIVNFHGGPEAQFIPRFLPIINLYAERGFVYVAPNVRGSDGYGKKWLQADNGVKRLNVITDIRDCAEFIKKNWAKNGVVPKVGITGGSYGGYSTLVGMSMFAESFDAGLAIVGMSNLITFIENTAPYRRALRMNEYGDPAIDREAMLKLSAVSYVDKVTKPLMIAHGASDPRVPVGEAVQFYETVQEKNKNSKLVIFPDEGHGVQKRPNIVLLNSYALDFFEKNLKSATPIDKK